METDINKKLEIAGPYPKVTIGIAVPEQDDLEVGVLGFAPIATLCETAKAYESCDHVPDAQRLVACWNAFRGVPTEKIQEYEVVQNKIHGNISLRKLRR